MERIHSTHTLEEIRRDTIPKKQEKRFYKIIHSPVGALIVVANNRALLSLTWKNNQVSTDDLVLDTEQNSILKTAELQLQEYFAGKRLTFEIPLEPKGTEFQKQVWYQLLKIPYGECITYSEQARRLGRPNAARAVGAANGKNPIGIIVPCHRVIGASGSLTGFAGGLDAKRKLLVLEGFKIRTT